MGIISNVTKQYTTVFIDLDYDINITVIAGNKKPKL